MRSDQRHPVRGASTSRALVVIGTGATLLAATARLAREHDISEREDRYFRVSNTLPDPVEVPLTGIMQFGSLGGALATGALFVGLRRPVAGAAVAGGGTAAWLAAKLVKHRVGRGRPGHHLEEVMVRGRPQTGLGFPSGHTAVAVTAAVVAGHFVSRPVGAVLASAALATGVARMYVGAHLPLDIVGGAGLGLAVGGAATLFVDRVAASPRN